MEAKQKGPSTEWPTETRFLQFDNPELERGDDMQSGKYVDV